MATPFSSARHQAALSVPTGYQRWIQVTVSRGGSSRVLEPVGASFTQDARRAGRWDGMLTFAGSDLMPRRPGDLLTPFGSTVSVQIGIKLLDGSLSTVPYGRYVVGRSKPRTSASERVTEVGLIDLSDTPERYRFESPRTVSSSTDLGAMINNIISNRTGFNPQVPNVGATLGAARVFGLDPETGPWSELLDVLDGFSRTAWYNRLGEIAVGSIDPDSSDAYSVDQQTSLSADFDTRPPNVVVARGEPQDGSTPVQAVAMDTDPSSPTYAGTGPGTSPYGRKTRFYSSPLIETVGQAQSAAQTILSQHVGQGAAYTLLRPFDPTIDAGDVISVDGSIYAVDAVTVDMMGDTSLQVREL